jgi:hypothetical protein
MRRIEKHLRSLIGGMKRLLESLLDKVDADFLQSIHLLTNGLQKRDI